MSTIVDRSSGVFVISLGLLLGIVLPERKQNTKLMTVPQISLKTGRHNEGSTELYCPFIAADSIVNAISFVIRKQVLFKFATSAGFEFQIRPGPAPSWFENSQMRYMVQPYLTDGEAL